MKKRTYSTGLQFQDLFSFFPNTSGILKKPNKIPNASLVSYVAVTFFSHGLGGRKRENEIQICNS